MARQIRLALAVTLALVGLISQTSFGQVCQSPGTTIVYINGINNDITGAWGSLVDLRNSLQAFVPLTALAGECLEFHLAYNRSEGIVRDLLQSARQQGVDDSQLWNFWNLFEPAPIWFLNRVIEAYAAIDPVTYATDADLRNHLGIYRDAIHRGHRVVAVGHSQGNFYGNEAHDVLYTGQDGTAALTTVSFGLVSVATPSYYVEGAVRNPGGAIGLLSRQRPYTTLKGDFIWQLPVDPTPLQYNVDQPCGDPLKCHSFESSYLVGSSKSLIMNQIVGVATSLERPVRCDVPHITPEELQFPATAVGSCAADLSFTITNPTLCSTIIGTASAWWRPSFTILSEEPISISAGQSATATVRFCPSWVGKWDGGYTFNILDSGVIPEFYRLSGTGIMCTPGQPCRPSLGECDPTEICTAEGLCLNDNKTPHLTACSSDNKPCTIDRCDGTSDLCQHVPGNAGSTCRPSSASCDPEERCTGSSPDCPPDVTNCTGSDCGNGTAEPPTEQCDLGSALNGSSASCCTATCQYRASGEECRPAAGVCDIPETCSGASDTCPGDALQPAETAADAVVVATMPEARYGEAVVWTGSRAYILGGSDGLTTFTTILEFDPATAVVAQAPGNLPIGAVEFSAVWNGSSAYTFGGAGCTTGGCESVAAIQEYSPGAQATSAVVAQLPSLRHAASVIWDGRYAFIFGGITGLSGGHLNEIVRFDPVTLSVTTMAAHLSHQRDGAPAVWTPYGVYIFGGYRNCGGDFCDDIDKYDPATDTLVPLSTKLPQRLGFSSAVWSGRFIYIFGGTHVGFISDQILRFDPRNESIAILADRLPAPRDYGDAFWDGQAAYIIGGMTANGPSNEIVRYVPAGECNPSHPYGVDANTVALWHLDDPAGNTFSDATGVNDGMVFGQADVVPGRFGTGRYFRGQGLGDYLTVPDSPTLRDLSAITIEAWVKPGPFSYYRESIVQKGDAGNPYNLYLLGLLGNPDGTFRFEFAFFNQNQSNASVNPISASLQPDQWYYIAGSYDGERGRLYVNGSLVAETAPVPGLVVTTTDPLFLDNDTYSGGIPNNGLITGTIDEVRISNVARSSAEIAATYDNSTGTCLAPPSGLVAWWPGDGNADDIIGGNNGTLQGGATFAPGEVRQAFSVRGQALGDYVEIPDAPSLRGFSQMTVEAWVFPTSLENYKDAIVIKGDETGSPAYNFYELDIRQNWACNSPGNSPFCFAFELGDGQVGAQAIASELYDFNHWYHVVATYDGDRARIYIDGALRGESASVPGMVVTTQDPVFLNNHTFFNHSSRSNGRMGGLIDEVGIYDRALAPSEIKAIFDAGSEGKCKPIFQE